MININISLVIQLVNFAIIYFLLKHFLFQPLLQVMDERRHRLNSLDSGFAAERQELLQLEENYRRKLGDYLSQATEVRTQTRRECEAEMLKAVDEAQAKAMGELAGHRDAVGKEIQSVAAKLEGELGGLKQLLVARFTA